MLVIGAHSDYSITTTSKFPPKKVKLLYQKYSHGMVCVCVCVAIGRVFVELSATAIICLECGKKGGKFSNLRHNLVENSLHFSAFICSEFAPLMLMSDIWVDRY